MIHPRKQEIIKKNKAEKDAFDAKMKAADDYLSAAETKKLDRPASEVLKMTVTKLKDAPK